MAKSIDGEGMSTNRFGSRGLYTVSVILVMVVFLVSLAAIVIGRDSFQMMLFSTLLMAVAVTMIGYITVVAAKLRQHEIRQAPKSPDDD